MKSYCSWHRIRDPGRALGYVRRVMVNQLASDARRRAVREVPSSHLPDTAAAASDDADQIRNESEIIEALGELPATQRTVIIMRY